MTESRAYAGQEQATEISAKTAFLVVSLKVVDVDGTLEEPNGITEVADNYTLFPTLQSAMGYLGDPNQSIADVFTFLKDGDNAQIYTAPVWELPIARSVELQEAFMAAASKGEPLSINVLFNSYGLNVPDHLRAKVALIESVNANIAGMVDEIKRLQKEALQEGNVRILPVNVTGYQRKIC